MLGKPQAQLSKLWQGPADVQRGAQLVLAHTCPLGQPAPTQVPVVGSQVWQVLAQGAARQVVPQTLAVGQQVFPMMVEPAGHVQR